MRRLYEIQSSLSTSKVLLEYSIAHLLVSVATATTRWQSQVAVSETVRAIESEIATSWPSADPCSKVSALPHHTVSFQVTLLRLLSPSVPCDCTCQGKQYFHVARSRDFLLLTFQLHCTQAAALVSWPLFLLASVSCVLISLHRTVPCATAQSKESWRSRSTHWAHIALLVSRKTFCCYKLPHGALPPPGLRHLWAYSLQALALPGCQLSGKRNCGAFEAHQVLWLGTTTASPSPVPLGALWSRGER